VKPGLTLITRPCLLRSEIRGLHLLHHHTSAVTSAAASAGKERKAKAEETPAACGCE